MKRIAPFAVSRIRKKKGRSILHERGGLLSDRAAAGASLHDRHRRGDRPQLVDLDGRLLDDGRHGEVHRAVHPGEVGDSGLEHVAHAHRHEDPLEPDARAERELGHLDYVLDGAGERRERGAQRHRREGALEGGEARRRGLGHQDVHRHRAPRGRLVRQLDHEQRGRPPDACGDRAAHRGHRRPRAVRQGEGARRRHRRVEPVRPRSLEVDGVDGDETRLAGDVPRPERRRDVVLPRLSTCSIAGICIR